MEPLPKNKGVRSRAGGKTLGLDPDRNLNLNQGRGKALLGGTSRSPWTGGVGCPGGSYHGGGGGGLVDLVLGRLDLGLQVGGRVEVLALLAGAAALDVVHAHGDRVVVGVDHGAVGGVGEAAVVLPAGAVAPLELPAHLLGGQRSWGRAVVSEATRDTG